MEGDWLAITPQPSQPPPAGQRWAGEKVEDSDNQRNIKRTGQMGMGPNTVHIPVTVTSPPGETLAISS